MAGAMSTACRDVRLMLAECLMLGLPLPAAVTGHLDDCQECCRDASDIKDVYRTLRRTWPHHLSPTEVPLPPGLGAKVHVGITEARQVRTRRRRRLAVGAAAVAAVVAAVTTPVWFGQRPPAPRSAVAVAREGQMVPHAWGTEVPVVLTGLHPGQTYRVMTADASGNCTPGGSMRVSEDETVHMRIMAAMPREAIAAVLVEDQSGKVMARLPIVRTRQASS
ncbi:hypothetical protein [Streptomyces sp. NPDC054765]